MKVNKLFDINEMIANQSIVSTTLDNGISVKKYIPYKDKIDFASDVVRDVVRVDDETEVVFIGYNENLYLTLNILKYYTDIDMDKVDTITLYDYVIGSGLFDEIKEAIGDDYNRSLELYYLMSAALLKVNAQSLSFSGTIKKMMDSVGTKEFTDALTNAKLESDGVMEAITKISDPLKRPNVSMLNFAKK